MVRGTHLPLALADQIVTGFNDSFWVGMLILGHQSVTPRAAADGQSAIHPIAIGTPQVVFFDPVYSCLLGLELNDLVLDVKGNPPDKRARVLAEPPYQVHVLLVEAPRVARAEPAQSSRSSLVVRGAESLEI